MLISFLYAISFCVGDSTSEGVGPADG